MWGESAIPCRPLKPSWVRKQVMLLNLFKKFSRIKISRALFFTERPTGIVWQIRSCPFFCWVNTIICFVILLLSRACTAEEKRAGVVSPFLTWELKLWECTLLPLLLAAHSIPLWFLGGRGTNCIGFSIVGQWWLFPCLRWFARMFDHSFPAWTFFFFFLKWRLAGTH